MSWAEGRADVLWGMGLMGIMRNGPWVWVGALYSNVHALTDGWMDGLGCVELAALCGVVWCGVWMVWCVV